MSVLTVRPIDADAILRLWEAGDRLDASSRAAAILAAALADDGNGTEQLAALPVAHQDELLLEVRRLTIGPVLEGVVECPSCGEVLDLAIDLHAAAARAVDAPRQWEGRGIALEFRLPTAADLDALRAMGDRAAARRLLAERCVVSATDAAGTAMAIGDDVVAAFAAAISQSGLDSAVAVTCDSCGHAWDAPLDVPSFLWAELRAEARRLLLEVDALARAYGWSEREILAMTPARRAAYLDLA